jgi:peptidoglycan-N-acetylglucosamine deacetylase
MIGYFGASTVGATWFGGGVVHGPRTADEVAITFDSGRDISSAAVIMRILDEENVKATFFIAGKAVDAQPQIVRALYADGHLVGNHSYHHDQWRWLDPRYPELQRTQDAFARDVGACPVWFRPPHGDKTPLMERVVHEHGMRMAMWDVSPGRKKTDDPNVVAERVLRAVKPGSIIDLNVELTSKDDHGQPLLVDALPQILAGLRERGLRPVRLDTLVGGPAYQSCTPS